MTLNPRSQDLAVRQNKSPPVSYSFRNIRNLDIVAFEKHLQSSQIFANPADTYLEQMESTVTAILDNLAPLRSRAVGRKGARWLDPEAVEAKQLRRRLERRWKKYGEECNRAAYRATCRQANELINSSRNRHRYPRIVEAKDSQRAWSVVKDLLHDVHVDNHEASNRSAEEDSTFCSSLALFFANKVQNIKSAISSALAGSHLNSLSSDLPSAGALSVFAPVTVCEY